MSSRNAADFKYASAGRHIKKIIIEKELRYGYQTRMTAPFLILRIY